MSGLSGFYRVERAREDFRVIVITLDDTDDAQVIFETLNSGGEPLAAMDLVRNDVFHRAIRRDEDPEELMAKRWSVFENPFWKQEAIQGRIRKPRIDFSWPTHWPQKQARKYC